MKYATFVDSRVLGVGGWHIGETREASTAHAQEALETIDVKYRSLHKIGGTVEVTEGNISWALGGGKSSLNSGPIYLHGLDIKAADVSRGTGGWDFRDIEGLV